MRLRCQHGFACRPDCLGSLVALSTVGRGGSSGTEYYYGRGGMEMKSDRGHTSYDGEAEPRDNRRRSVQKRF